MANGNVAPSRVIEGQVAKLARTIHGIAYDPVHDEIIVTNPLASAVLVFRGGANGDEAPIRVIQGPRTRLLKPETVSVDVVNGEIIVADPGEKSVLLFRHDANGDVAPARVLQGPKTKLGWVIGTAVDPIRNVLVVANHLSVGQSGLFIFNRTDNGDVAPRAIILGPKTGIVSGPWQVQISQGKIFVAVTNGPYNPLYDLIKPRQGLRPNVEIKSPWRSDILGAVAVWDITDNGDIPPRAIIKGPVSGLVHPGGVAINPKNGEIYAVDSVRNGLFTYLVPEFFN